MNPKKPSHPRRTTPKRKPGVTFADVEKTLRDLDKRCDKRGKPVFIWPEPKSKTGRRPWVHTDIEIFGLLLRTYFDGTPLQQWVPPKPGSTSDNAAVRPANGSLFNKLALWTTGDTPALPSLWASYLLKAPRTQLIAWRARLLGIGRLVKREGAPRYVNRSPTPELIFKFIRVCRQRGLKLY